MTRNDEKVTVQFERFGRNGRLEVKEKTFKSQAAFERWAEANDVRILRFEA